MSRIAILNIFIGFSAICIAAAAGSFIAMDLSEAYLIDSQIKDSWQAVLLRSAHGHTNMFAMIHILFGLTLPYSSFKSIFLHRLQTMGLLSATLCFAILVPIRGYVGVTAELDFLAILIGILLNAGLIALLVHAIGLARKYFRC